MLHFQNSHRKYWSSHATRRGKKLLGSSKPKKEIETFELIQTVKCTNLDMAGVQKFTNSNYLAMKIEHELHLINIAEKKFVKLHKIIMSLNV